MAHAFVAGGLPSDSERDIAVGGISVVPLELFDGIDYTALGHLHGRATLSESVRYSGSPIAYSFSEAGHVKGSWLVDLDADGFERGDASSRRRSPGGSPGSRAPSTTCSPTPASREHEDSWVQATLTDDAPAARRRWSGCARASRTPWRCGSRRAVASATPVPRRRPPGARPTTIALDFVAHVRGAPATDAESDLLRDGARVLLGGPRPRRRPDAVVIG